MPEIFAPPMHAGITHQEQTLSLAHFSTIGSCLTSCFVVPRLSNLSAAYFMASRCLAACFLVPSASILLAHFRMTGELRESAYFLVVSRPSIIHRPLQDVEVITTTSLISTFFLIPRTSIVPSPFQDIEVAMRSCGKACVLVPRTPIFPSPY